MREKLELIQIFYKSKSNGMLDGKHMLMEEDKFNEKNINNHGPLPTRL